jgi:hypothetical protein
MQLIVFTEHGAGIDATRIAVIEKWNSRLQVTFMHLLLLTNELLAKMSKVVNFQMCPILVAALFELKSKISLY